MTIRISEGLKNAMLSSYGLQAMMNYGVIEVRSGVQPQTASKAPTGVVLGYVTQNGAPFVPGEMGGGLQTELSVSDGLILSGVWRLKGVATGDVGWWRWKWNLPDNDQDSFYYPRIDGAYGESLQLAIGTVTPATDVAITSFTVNYLE